MLEFTLGSGPDRVVKEREVIRFTFPDHFAFFDHTVGTGANGNSSTDWSNTNTNADFFGKSGRSTVKQRHN